MRTSLTLLTMAAVAASGCSSRPRNFAPVLGAAPADAAIYDAQLQSCREELALQTNRKSGRAGSAVAGVASGAGATVAVGAAASGTTYATIGGAMAALGATIIAAPVAGILGAWGISKIKKTKKERAIKTAMGDCLQRSGYSVASWRVMSKREAKQLRAQAKPIAPIGEQPTEQQALLATTANP